MEVLPSIRAKTSLIVACVCCVWGGWGWGWGWGGEGIC